MSKGYVIVSWENTPHLDKATRDELEASFLPHERDARTKGIPSLGSGAIYPVAESEIICEPFQCPAWYRRAYAMDVGWNRTAALWIAYDPESDIVYLTDEYYRGQAEPAIHAEAIKARGKWIPGVIDPASRGRSQHDGRTLLDTYTELGLVLSTADNAVEAGIYRVWSRLSTGRLKVFSTLQNFLQEYRIYRRDEKGKIIKQDDHLIDCVKYACASAIDLSVMCPAELWSTRPGMPPALQKSRHEIEYDPFAEARHVGGARPQQPGAGSKSNWMPHGERRR